MLLLLIDVFVNFFLQKRKSLIVFVVFIRKLGLDEALAWPSHLCNVSFLKHRFQGLIDREWLRGGHPFAERCVKVGVSPSRYKGQGPVFLLFLDCVWQVS